MGTARVRLFARLADIVGARETEIEFDEDLTAADVLSALIQRYPAMADCTAAVRFAVNAEYVPGTHPVHDGDEVALIPPVSGGGNAL